MANDNLLYRGYSCRGRPVGGVELLLRHDQREKFEERDPFAIALV